MSTLLRRIPLLLAFAAILAFSVPAFAADRDDQGRYYPAYGQGNAQYAYDNGYRKGADQGRDDARHNRAFDYARDKDYRNADDGYKDRYGGRDWYRNEFRRGYVDGYTRAYNQYAPRGGYYGNRGYGYDPRDGDGGYYGNGGYYGRAVPRNDVAANAGYNKGYNDGLEKGSKDARSRHAYEPERHGWYRDADRGYNGRYGPKFQYEAAYRQGFLAGYQEAYRGRGYYDRRW